MSHYLLLDPRRKNTLLIHPFLISKTAYIQLMNSVCILSRSDLVHGLIPMIGLNALLFIQGRMPGEGTQGSFITAVSLVLIFARVLAGEGICVNTLMVFLSVGCILHNIEPVSARTG
jgi:hypothetical protein